jgi:hypothetical protein
MALASNCQRQRGLENLEAMLEINMREGASTTQSRVDLALHLLSQQEKLLEHPWSSADVYLYDFRAHQISDLIAEVENEDTLERRRTSLVAAQVPASSWRASSVKNSATKRLANPTGWVLLLGVSSWITVSNMFGRIWAFLALPLFHQRKRESSSSAAVT